MAVCWKVFFYISGRSVWSFFYIPAGSKNGNGVWRTDYGKYWNTIVESFIKKSNWNKKNDEKHYYTYFTYYVICIITNGN